MADAAYAQVSFLGGEVSAIAQGRFDLPTYRMSMNVCLNTIPLEPGACTRRPGSMFAGTTRGGAPGRTITFDVEQDESINLEFTDNFLRFRLGATPVTTNDDVAISAISSANPAVVQTASAVTWLTGNTAILTDLGANSPLLQNRQFLLTKVDTTHFSLRDAITGANIDGATLGTFVSGTIARVLEIATNYGAGSWSSIRSVQAETQAILLNGSLPYVLTLDTPATPITDPTLSLAAADFQDGPYLDPYPGSVCTYDAVSGNVALTFAFQAYSATKSYSVGDYATYSGQGYKSRTAANLNNQPDTHSTNWLAVNGGAPVSPSGFVGSDVGRHIRLFSEPADWAAGTFAANVVVKYQDVYWQSLGGSNSAVPGADPTKWAIVTGQAYAKWTWGRVLSVSGTGLIAPGTAIGNFTSSSAAFDGTTSKSFGSSARTGASATTYPAFVAATNYGVGSVVEYIGSFFQSGFSIPVWFPAAWPADTRVYYDGSYYVATRNVALIGAPPPTAPVYWASAGVGNPSNGGLWANIGAAASVSIDAYAGQDYHLSAKAIIYATVFPSTDQGFGANLPAGAVVLNLRGKASAPSSASDGTLLGTSGAISNTFSAVTIASNDATTTWAYVWVEFAATNSPPLPDDGSHTFTMTGGVAQVEFFAPNVANGSVITVQLAGDPLLYAPGAVVRLWRAGVYSDTTGWPKCGCYHEGRLWLSGVVGNRFDSSKSNKPFIMSPTLPDGTVTDDSAISYTLTAKDVNAIFWMISDQRGIVIGTQAREWLVQASDNNNNLTPTSIQAHPFSKNGCADIEPREAGLTLLFVERYTRKLMECFADVYSGKFTSPNLSASAKHLTKTGIAEIAYQKELVPIAWVRCTDGSLVGSTYKREVLNTAQGPSFNGWHRHRFGSQRLVESIAVGPSVGGNLDSLTMVTNDPVSTIRHVEILTNLFEEGSVLTDAWFLDDAVQASSYSVTSTDVVVNGLWHLNGKSATVFAGGLDRGEFTVASGSVTIPLDPANGNFTADYVTAFGGAMPIVAGFTYTSQGQLLRPLSPAESGARNGPALGKIRRTHVMASLLKDTGCFAYSSAPVIYFGTSFAKLRPASFKSPGGTPLSQLVTFSGVYRDTIDDDYSYDSMLCWQVTRPLPATVVAVEGLIQTQDS